MQIKAKLYRIEVCTQLSRTGVVHGTKEAVPISRLYALLHGGCRSFPKGTATSSSVRANMHESMVVTPVRSDRCRCEFLWKCYETATSTPSGYRFQTQTWVQQADSAFVALPSHLHTGGRRRVRDSLMTNPVGIAQGFHTMEAARYHTLKPSLTQLMLMVYVGASHAICTGQPSHQWRRTRADQPPIEISPNSSEVAMAGGPNLDTPLLDISDQWRQSTLLDKGPHG